MGLRVASKFFVDLLGTVPVPGGARCINAIAGDKKRNVEMNLSDDTQIAMLTYVTGRGAVSFVV